MKDIREVMPYEGHHQETFSSSFRFGPDLFFLPFVTFSCQGQPVASLSGIQLATGTRIQQPQVFGPPKEHQVDVEPLATVGTSLGSCGRSAEFSERKKVGHWFVGAGGPGCHPAGSSEIQGRRRRAQARRRSHSSQLRGGLLSLPCFPAGGRWNQHLLAYGRQGQSNGFPYYRWRHQVLHSMWYAERDLQSVLQTVRIKICVVGMEHNAGFGHLAST